MTDPYKILGVSPQASDDEIKTAYRKLCQQYHPDRQQDGVMEEIATEKMAEINAAYDEIMDMRRNGINNSEYSNTSQNGYNSYTDFYSQVRTQIEHGNYTAADNMLESNRHDEHAEWNFLKGTVCLSRGWMNDAYSYIEKATRLAPQNREYQMAFSQLRMKRGGQMQGNPYTNTRSSSGDSLNTLCNICQCLMCADCLCDCI